MDVLRLGVLFSTAGAYGALSRDCREGADLSVAHLREDGGLPFDVAPVVGDPLDSADRYASLADGMMREGRCRHIIGTVASRSRKIADLDERIRLRPLVLAAAQSVMAARGCEEAVPDRRFRQDAVRSRHALEHVAAAFLAGACPRSEAG